MRRDESEFTPWGAGWSAPNQWSPEFEWTEFVGAWVALQRPGRVLETGGGSGAVTFEILGHRPDGSEVTVIEDDKTWRARLTQQFLNVADVSVFARATPADFEAVDLAVLDSLRSRCDEIAAWGKHARPDTFALVHDASRRHALAGIRSTHLRIAQAVERLGDVADIVFTPNPRGGALLRHR